MAKILKRGNSLKRLDRFEMSSNYQTVLYPDGQAKAGVFPTLEWFDYINEVVPFVGNSVLDVGCAEGMMSLLAARAGARFVTGIDRSEEKTDSARQLQNAWHFSNVRFIHCNADEFLCNDDNFDIVIASMILHWLDGYSGALRKLADRANKYLVVIFRERNSHYLSEHGRWFPSLTEVSDALGDCALIRSEHIATQDHGKRILLAIYRTDVSIESDGKIVRKRVHVSENWARSINDLLRTGAPMEAFLGPTPFGYRARFIDGVDLWGHKVFQPRQAVEPLIPSPVLRMRLLELLRDLLTAALQSRSCFSDLTFRNIVVKDGIPFLIDFDDIIELTQDDCFDERCGEIARLWQVFLSYVGVDYPFMTTRNVRELLGAIEEVISND